MASFIDFNCRDINGAPSKMRVPITPQTPPTGIVTYAGAVGSAIFGATKLSMGGYLGAQLVIDLGLTAATPLAASEARNKWQATMVDASGLNFRFGIPVRWPDASLITPGTEIVGDITNAAFTAVLAALINASGAINMVHPTTGTVVDHWAPVLATTRSRKRPRVGGSR